MSPLAALGISEKVGKPQYESEYESRQESVGGPDPRAWEVKQRGTTGGDSGAGFTDEPEVGPGAKSSDTDRQYQSFVERLAPSCKEPTPHQQHQSQVGRLMRGDPGQPE